MAADAATPRGAIPALPALERLEQRLVEAERLFKLQHEATERLFKEQRVALDEHRRAWEQQQSQCHLGKPDLPLREGKTVEPDLQKDMGVAPHKQPRLYDATPGSSDGDSDSSNSDSNFGLSEMSMGGSQMVHPNRRRMAALSSSLTVTEEIQPHSRCQECLLRFSQSRFFEHSMLVLVIISAISFGIQVHHDVQETLQPDVKSNWVDTVMPACDCVFLVVFLLELALRLVAEQLAFFVGPNRLWNVFDAVVITLCTVDEIRNRKDGGSMSSLRAVRLLRPVLRVVRVLRVFRFLRHLRMMLVSILSCLVSLFWSLLFLAVVMYMFALYLGEVIIFHFQDSGNEVNSNDEMHKVLIRNWDGIPVSIRSLVFSISGGADWADLAAPFWDINVVHGIMYTLFILFTSFGLLNIMVGVFMQEASGILKWDRELVLEDVLDKEDSRYVQLQDLFFELDQDRDNLLSLEELSRGFEDSHIKAYFTHLNIDMAKAPEFFGFLDADGSGYITMDEFIAGSMRFQGSARPLEVASLLIETKALGRKVDNLGLHINMIAAPRDSGAPVGPAIVGDAPPCRTASSPHGTAAPNRVVSPGRVYGYP